MFLMNLNFYQPPKANKVLVYRDDEAIKYLLMLHVGAIIVAYSGFMMFYNKCMSTYDTSQTMQQHCDCDAYLRLNE